MRRTCVAIVMVWIAAAACVPCLAAEGSSVQSSRQSSEEHAGKAIIRSDVVAPAAQPAGNEQTSLDLDAGRVALALMAVIGLILLLRYVGRQLFPAVISAGRGQSVKVLARCPLAPKQQVVLIQVGRRIVVAADCSAQLSSLCQITDADEVAALIGQIQSDRAGPVSSPFTAWFSRAAEAFHSEGEDGVEGDEGVGNVTHSEIRGLTEKVRQMARELGKSA